MMETSRRLFEQAPLSQQNEADGRWPAFLSANFWESKEKLSGQNSIIRTLQLLIRADMNSRLLDIDFDSAIKFSQLFALFIPHFRRMGLNKASVWGRLQFGKGLRLDKASVWTRSPYKIPGLWKALVYKKPQFVQGLSLYKLLAPQFSRISLGV